MKQVRHSRDRATGVWRLPGGGAEYAAGSAAVDCRAVKTVSRRLRAAPIYLENRLIEERTVSHEHFIRAVLIRTLPVACAIALVLAGCEEASPAKEPDPDTTPKFRGSVASQTYKELAPIEPLTLPQATGGNGRLSYSLGPEVPPGLSFDSGTRTLTGTPRQTDRAVTYRMTYRVVDADDNRSSRDTDSRQFSITILPLTVLETVASSVVAGEAEGSLEFEPLPLPTGGPTISLSGSGTIVAGGAFFLQVAPEPGATVDTLLASIQRDPAGYFEVDVQGAAPPYLLIGQVPYGLDPTRPGVGICVTAVHALDRVGRTACRDLTIADALPGDVQVTLSWDVDSAVDLLVLDPEGNAVSRVALGGSDPDSNPSCNALDHVRNEHVAWSAGGASPSPGVYSVLVRLQDACDTFETNYVVRLKHGEETSTFSGKLKRAGQEAAVTTFRVDGPMPPAAIRKGITETYAGSGNAVFSLNPEGEILDETPFTLQLGNAATDVYLIATNTGHHPMQPHVVRLDRTQGATAAGQPVTAAARRAQRSSAGSPPAVGRAWVTEFNNDTPLPPSDSCIADSPPAAQPVIEGTTRFDFLSLDADRNRVTIPATVRKVVVDGTTTLVVWVADRDWQTCSDCVRGEVVDALAARFLQPNESNDILQLVTAIFGDPWGTHDRQCLIPAEFANVLHILLYDIDDDGLPSPGAARDRGFFWAKDNYLKDPFSSVTSTSNERLMIYLDAPLLAQPEGHAWEISDAGPRQALATLIHELQHMIHFYQKRVRWDVASETWLNEMASEVAEDLLAKKLAIPGADGPRAVMHNSSTAGTPQNKGGRLPLYNLHNDLRVTAWDGTESSSAMAYALGAYLARAYGGAALFSSMVQNRWAGIAAVQSALGATRSVSFADLLADWAVANLLSDDLGADPRYRYNSGRWSESDASGVTFEVGSINLYNYRYETPSFSQEGPFLYSLDGFNERTQPPHSNMYATLGRNTGTVRLQVSAVSGNRIAVVVKD